MRDDEELRAIEATRLRALVERDMPTARRLHAEDYQLVTPRGATLSKSDYLDSIASGELRYDRFEPVSDIQVLRGSGDIAVLRYQCAIDVVSTPDHFVATCWHTDCYRFDDETGWQAVWSHATVVQPAE